MKRDLDTPLKTPFFKTKEYLYPRDLNNLVKDFMSHE